MPSTKPTKPFNPHAAARSGKRNLILAVIALLAAIVALVFSAMTWVKSSHISQLATLSQQLHQGMQKQHQQVQTQLQTLQAQQNAQAQTVASTQGGLSNLLRIVNNTRMQRLLSEVSYSLNLANLHLTIAHDTQTSLKLLQLVQKRLQQNSSPILFNLKRAIAGDIDQLKTLPNVDVAELVIRLDTLQQQINQLPMIPKAPHVAQNPANQAPSLAAQPWYVRLGHELAGLKSLVIIRRVEKPVMPLISPQQQVFLEENIAIKLAQVQWAVLHQNAQIYQHNLTTVGNWIKRYYRDPNAVAQLEKQINVLLKIDIKPKAVNLSNTLAALQQTLTLSQSEINTPAAKQPLSEKEKSKISPAAKPDSKPKTKPAAPTSATGVEA